MATNLHTALALVDANNFYVACERLCQPRLRGRSDRAVYQAPSARVFGRQLRESVYTENRSV